MASPSSARFTPARRSTGSVLQAAHLGVEIVEAGGEAREMAVALVGGAGGEDARFVEGAAGKLHGGGTPATRVGIDPARDGLGEAEEQAGREQPQPRRARAPIQRVGEHAAGEHAHERRALQEDRGVQRGVGEVQRKFFVQEIWQPAVKQPQPEDEHGKHHAEQPVGVSAGQMKQRAAGGLGMGCFRCRFAHAPQEQKARQREHDPADPEDVY